MQHQNKDNLSALRHSAEHVLMQAMIKLYPDIKMAMGPATDEGFYFDFDLEQKISLDDFLKIEDEMQKIIDDVGERLVSLFEKKEREILN